MYKPHLSKEGVPLTPSNFFTFNKINMSNPLFKEIKDDLIELAKEGEFEIIAHGCNCLNTMGAGIAATIKDTWPQVFDADRAVPAGYNKLGTLTYAEISDPSDPNNCFWVANLYTQAKPGGGSFDYEALRLCLRKLAVLAKKYAQVYGKTPRIGLPHIGAGIARGDWNIIKQIIKQELIENYVTLVSYEPRKQEETEESTTNSDPERSPEVREDAVV